MPICNNLTFLFLGICFAYDLPMEVLMTKTQEKLIEKFKSLAGKKTFTEYADITGIERTRLFRLFNGADMKMSEYEKIKAFLEKEDNTSQKNFLEKATYLNESVRNHFYIEMDRKHRLGQLLKSA